MGSITHRSEIIQMFNPPLLQPPFLLQNWSFSDQISSGPSYCLPRPSQPQPLRVNLPLPVDLEKPATVRHFYLKIKAAVKK
jgi:hypothetical protein